MKIFNLAEELEKERKKNKELEERNEVLEKGCKEYRYHIKQMNKIHDNCLNTIEELQEVLDKAIKYIEQFDFDYLDATYNHSTREILEDLLNILRGDNK